MNSPGRMAAVVLGVAAVAFFIAALFQTWERYRTAILWKPVRATVVDRNIGFRHDGDGRLRFFVRASLRYTTPSGDHTAAADSEFDSVDFAAVRSRIENYTPGSTVKAYYDPANHGTIRVGAEYTAAYLGRAVPYYAAAAGCAFLAALAPVLWRGKRTCAACKTKLKHHYRFCTFCGAPSASVAHLICNERPAET